MIVKLRHIIAKLEAGAFSQLSQKKRLKLLLITASLLALAYAGLSWLVFNNCLTGFDAAVEEAISTWSFKGLHTYFDFVTDSRTIVGTTMLAVASLFLRKRVRLAAFIILATGGSWLLSLLFKFMFQRVRPGVDIDDDIFAYPSGHATLAICLYGALIFITNEFVRTRWVKLLINTSLALFIISIGLSRVYFGYHYPTDVLAGWLMGGSYLLFLIIGYHLSGLLKR